MTDWDRVRYQVEHDRDDVVLDLMCSLWTSTTNPVDKRLHLVPILTSACRRCAAVRAHFVTLRDASTPELGARKGLMDWLELNEVLDEQARTLQWFDACREAGVRPPRFSRLERAVRQRGDAADFLWLLDGGALATVRGAIAVYLCQLSLHRGQMIDAEMQLEVMLERVPFAERRPRDDIERLIELDCAEAIALVLFGNRIRRSERHDARCAGRRVARFSGRSRRRRSVGSDEVAAVR